MQCILCDDSKLTMHYKLTWQIEIYAQMFARVGAVTVTEYSLASSVC